MQYSLVRLSKVERQINLLQIEGIWRISADLVRLEKFDGWEFYDFQPFFFARRFNFEIWRISF